jgi:hypothetical protein
MLNIKEEKMEQNNIQYAFPDEGNFGMTLRDYYAAKALPSLLRYFLKEEFHLTDITWMEGVAMDAYKMADAMMKAREA